MIYERIHDFCKAKNLGPIWKNGEDPTPRVKFIVSLLEELGIEYKLDVFNVREGCNGFNILISGTSNRMVMAHHDIVNPNIDNANDNSASVINAIALKVLCPEIKVAIVDGEEVGGLGSERVAKQINDGIHGEIDWVLNLELTGRGGKNFFIGDYPGNLSSHILENFECPVHSTPFNDTVILRSAGIDSVVINPLPVLENGSLDFSMLGNCHSSRDTLDTISTSDMKEFVEGVLVKIVA